MNIKRVHQALFTLLVHPQHMNESAKTDLTMALYSDEPFEQGQVAELMRTMLIEHVAGRLA